MTPGTYAPTVQTVPGVVAGVFTGVPSGVILHGTRSGIAGRSVQAELDSTMNYVKSGAAGLGWNLTVGDDVLAEHLPPTKWGWNAREHSSQFLAVEFAQATADQPISDAQVRAFVWWFRQVARDRYPTLPLKFPMHSELAAGIRDGKTDTFPRGDHRGQQLKDRILAEFKRQGG